MKLFEVVEMHYDDSGRPVVQTSSWVNPEYIISVEPLKGSSARSTITVQGAMTRAYYDIRTPDVIISLLKS